MAAEFSPALEADLSKASMSEPISAIVILASPVDIRALDLRLHDTGAPLAKRHAEVIQALKYNAEFVQPAFRKEFEAAIKPGEMFGFTAHWIENLFVIQATRSYIEVTESFTADFSSL